MNNINGNTNFVVDPNAQVVTPDGGHQSMLNPSAQIVISNGG